MKHFRGQHTTEVKNKPIRLCIYMHVGFPRTLLNLQPASVFNCTKTQKPKKQKPTRVISLAKDAIWRFDSTMIQLNFVEREHQLSYTIKSTFQSVMAISFIFTYAMSWNATWNCLVRCSDSVSKYRSGQCEPRLTFNYLKCMKQTGKSLSRPIKINKVRIVTTSTLRAEFLSSFILPVFCSGHWTQGLGHWTVGKDTQKQRNGGTTARAPWALLMATSLEKLLELTR